MTSGPNWPAGRLDGWTAGRLDGWTANADPPVGEHIATGIEAILPVLTDHLAEEEQLILPIVSVHITQTEWQALAKHGFGAIPGRRRLVILGHILEQTDDCERRSFLLNVPPPARRAYKLLGRRHYARETALIRG